MNTLSTKNILSFLLLTLACSVQGQQMNPRLLFSDDPLPKTPEVNSLFRYSPDAFGNTGKINFSIPIYTVAVDEVQLPIAIAYQGDGLKVGELPSRVGLGWTLIGGGAINRQVRGLPDEESNFGILKPIMRQLVQNYSTNPSPMTALQKAEFLGKVANGTYDSEFDLFTFQIGSLSGSFFIDITGNVRVFSARDIKVSFDPSYNQFTITDEGGNIYTFSSKESTVRNNAPDSSPLNIHGTSTWHITTIQTYQGKNISFTYHQEEFRRTEPTRTDHFRLINSNGCSSVQNSTFTSDITQGGLQLASITFPMGKLIFNQGAIRGDMTDYQDGSYPSNNPGKTLLSIDIRDFQNTLLKTFELTHGYFGTTGSRRLKLISVQEKSQTQTAQTYSFSYYNETSTYPHLKYTGYTVQNDSYFSQDHWGYYNGKSNQSLLPTINMQSNVNPNLDAASKTTQGNRNADPTYALYGMLKTVTLPTKGSITYEYEGNRVYYSNCTEVPFMIRAGNNQSCTLPYYVGGMRVKKETACPDGSGNNCINRIIKYEAINGSTVLHSGQLYAIPNYIGNASYFFCEGSGSGGGQQQFTQTVDPSSPYFPVESAPSGSICGRLGGCIDKYCHIATLSDHNLVSIGGGNIIEYPFIEVLEGVNGEAGKTLSWYNLSSTQGAFTFPYPVIWVKTWEGSLKLQIVYRNVNGSFKPLIKTANTYTNNNLNDSFYDVSPKVGVTLSNASFGCQRYNEKPQYLGQPFYRLSQQSTTEYTHDTFGNLTDSLKTHNYYYHDNLSNHVQLTKSVVEYLGLLKQETFYRYPKDFNVASATDVPSLAVSNLKTFNRIVPLEIYTKDYDHNNILAGHGQAQTLTYKIENGKAFPRDLFMIKAPVSSFTPINYGATFSKDSKYELELQYQQYDLANNPVQRIDRTGVIQSVVFGYPAQSKPIISITRVSYNSLITYAPSLPSLSNESDIHNTANFVRGNFSTELVNSYSHKPMTGVSSIVAPNSLKTSYSYDSFLRLLAVKDTNGNIVDYFRYIYAQIP